jgi:hypothetical protein
MEERGNEKIYSTTENTKDTENTLFLLPMLSPESIRVWLPTSPPLVATGRVQAFAGDFRLRIFVLKNFCMCKKMPLTKNSNADIISVTIFIRRFG